MLQLKSVKSVMRPNQSLNITNVLIKTILKRSIIEPIAKSVLTRRGQRIGGNRERENVKY
jgi:hypothetical protein